MSQYLKYFDTQSDYETYITESATLPNISYRQDKYNLRYNSSFPIVAEYNVESDIQQYIFIDDFPQDICDRDYNGDMSDFKAYMVENLKYTNMYEYTGETLNYDGQEFYLWEYKIQIDDDENDTSDMVKYILTDTLDFDGKSLEENNDSDYCPFIYILNSDKELLYDNTEADDYFLVASRKGTKIAYENCNGFLVKIDHDKMAVLENNYYDFGKAGKHTIEFSFNALNHIPMDFFINTVALISIKISDTIHSIGEYAFSRCSNLVNVILSDTLDNIPDSTFMDCSKIEKIVIPHNVQSIGDSAFLRCEKLTSVVCLATVPPILGPASFNHNAAGRKIYVPSDSLDEYKSDWDAYEEDIEAI